MPTTRSQAKRAKPAVKQLEQPRVGINKLPPEVLSEIFVICDRTWDPLDGNWNFFVCQIVFPSICRHWRKVALDTTALWNKVTLLDRAPWHFSKLCLLRSGSTAPLDIDLCMDEKFWAGSEEGTLDESVQRAKDAFAFIVQHGGALSRWRTLTMVTDIFLVQVAAMTFLGKHHFPSLTSLEMTFNGPDEFDDKDRLALQKHLRASPKVLFGGPLPQLRSVKLQGVPNPYLFGHRVHPQLVGLTHLELRFEGLYPSLINLNKMLIANPLLETLIINAETMIEWAIDSVKHENLSTVHLPKLQSLSFAEVVSPLWTLHAIKSLDAPHLISFELTLNRLAYITFDESNNVQALLNHIIGDQNKTPPTPRFPSLRSLTLASDEINSFQRDAAAVLAAYPDITALMLPSCSSLSPLLKRPWLAPNIERLRVGVQKLTQLKKVVSSRCKAGLPLRTVLVDNLELEVEVKLRDRAELRKYVDFAVVLDDGERIGEI
ncbi:putative serine/threonine-protein kinase pats1 [Rhizoctonia solani]|uniref:Putative serine/threonine-protein kinase pats1 n=1 Tax=Rhizoctonia solani TaxID=456999 RepID=A0A0K6GCM8_9AGAM|nr:putative serine/threonine-protein kinase pats1 [Rhizoctonia solani]